ncbi:hypothetical protein [Xylanimonas sp. McL0601]|uniref:hypothetical protein n=1 Tax=Xylanimonas sp. McL0601 TaxID=3414739 RepID=UPI003CF7E117
MTAKSLRLRRGDAMSPHEIDRFWGEIPGEVAPTANAVAWGSAMAVLIAGVPLTIALAITTSALGLILDFPVAAANTITYYWIPLSVTLFILSHFAPHTKGPLVWKVLLGWPTELVVLGVVTFVCTVVYA